jgi:hypothetical protein
MPKDSGNPAIEGARGYHDGRTGQPHGKSTDTNQGPFGLPTNAPKGYDKGFSQGRQDRQNAERNKK